MNKVEELLNELNLNENIQLDDVPNIDLYMDQVIQLFESKLGNSKRNDEDKILTKTMINNYSKGKLFMNIKNKKYSKKHIILMCLIYELKGCLSIPDIKTVLNPIVSNYDNDEEEKIDIEKLYTEYLKVIEENEKYIKEDINRKAEENSDLDDYESRLILLCYLINKANMYRRLSEKLIDELMN